MLAEIDAGASPFAALSSESARRLGGESGWNALLETLEAGARRAQSRASSGKSAGESRTILGRVLAATGNAVSAPGGLSAMRVLPRFETVAQRTSDDLAAARKAPSTRPRITQRITENTRATRRSSSRDSPASTRRAGVPAVEGEAATRLGEVRTAFAAYEKQLQGTLEQAGALATAQRAATDLARRRRQAVEVARGAVRGRRRGRAARRPR